MNFPVIDLHCDTVLALLGDDMNQAGSLRKNDFHIDLERASRLGGYAQCFACFTTPFMEKRHHVSPWSPLSEKSPHFNGKWIRIRI